MTSHFENSGLILFIIAGVSLAIVCLCLYGYKKRTKIVLPSLGAREVGANQLARIVVLLAFMALAAYVLVSVAADSFEERQTGLVACAIDESRSAAAENNKGVGRIERERAIAINLCTSLPDLLVAAYGFTDRASSQSSFSKNYKHFRDTINYLAAIEAVPGSGSDLGYSLFNIAEELAQECQRLGKRSCLVVFASDGENIGKSATLADALRFARANNIKVIAVGVGETESVPIPIYDEYGRLVDYEKDSSGNRFLTKLDEDTMRLIAEETGGIYVREDELDKARGFLAANLKKEKMKADNPNSPLAAILLIAALVPLILYARLSKT